MEKYFPSEDWEEEYYLKTAVIRRIGQYAGLNFHEVVRLPYSYFLFLNRESWIDSYQSSKEGRETLKDLWRLRQTKADLAKIRKFQTGKGG